MPRETTSRGASSASGWSSGMKRWPCGVEQDGALAADGLGDQQRPAGRRDRRRPGMVGWNWKNSRSAHRGAGAQARARPSAVATAGLVVWAKSWPAPPVARTTASAGSCRGRPSARYDAGDPAASAAGHGPGSGRQQVGDERAGLHPEPARTAVQDGALQHGGDQCAGDAGAGGVAAGVQDARRGVGGLQAQGGAAVVVRVELHAEPMQLGDVPGAPRVHSTRTASGSLQARRRRPGCRRCGPPRCRPARPPVPARRDAALGVAGVAVLERPLVSSMTSAPGSTASRAASGRRCRCRRRAARRAACGDAAADGHRAAGWSRPRRQHPLEGDLGRAGDVLRRP